MKRTEQPDFEKVGINPERIGLSFEAWLVEEKIDDHVHEAAAKELFSEQLQKEMRAKKINKTALASAIGTSRSQMNRILDPACDAVTLGALKKAAAAVGKRLRIELEDDNNCSADVA